MNILQELNNKTVWNELIEYKESHQHLNQKEEKMWREYIENEAYIPTLNNIHQIISDNSSEEPNHQTLPLPIKREINKSGTNKKRVIYSYPDDFNRVLKMITYKLYYYDDKFAPNCYAFRRGTGVNAAVKRVQHIIRSNAPQNYPVMQTDKLSHSKQNNSSSTGLFCLKADISNYFNSIDVPILLERLQFLKNEDPALFKLFELMLTADAAIITTEQNCTKHFAHKSDTINNYDSTDITDFPGTYKIINEHRGAMAGTPVSPFFANVYLMEMDWYFHNNKIDYFRYSDDILIFADSYEKLMKYKDILYKEIEHSHLSLNPDKVKIYLPGDPIEFLGLKFENGTIDISDNTMKKIKARIKRKAEALRRWARKKNLSGEKCAKGFIKAMNRKFFDSGNDKDFSWSRWFFPNLTTDKSLSIIDDYMQEYIRYCVTGRHYKGNYRISYDQMKSWGYRNLVHEYYSNLHTKREQENL